MSRQDNASAKSKEMQYHPQADTVAAQLPQRTKTNHRQRFISILLMTYQ